MELEPKRLTDLILKPDIVNLIEEKVVNSLEHIGIEETSPTEN